MTNELILLIVSIAAAALSLASTAWGLTKELSVKDEQQKKHLTREGQVAIALAIGGAILATTSLGMRELIDRQKKADAIRSGLEAKAAAEKKALDETRWRGFNDQQQRILARLGVEETVKQGGRVVTNQQLLAAIEQQRDQALAASSRLFQLAQSQSIVQQVKPLGSLRVTMRFGGLSARQFAELEEGVAAVEKLPEQGDEYDALRFDSANRYADVLLPLLRQFVVGDDRVSDKRGTEVVAVLDLDGTGSWLLPFGVTGKTEARGMVVSGAYLYEVAKPNGTLEGINQNIGPCIFPQISLEKAKRTAIVYWEIPGGCLPFAMHRQGQFAPVARISSDPALVLFRDGADMFPLSALNVAEMEDWVRDNCWRPGAAATGRRFIDLEVVANNGTRVTKRLRERGSIALDQYVGKYDHPLNAAFCNFFG